jgi:hypothetical protein
VLSLIKFTKFMTSVWETLYPVDGELVWTYFCVDLILIQNIIDFDAPQTI